MEDPTILIWAAGHKSIPGNEVADALAKAATAKALIQRTTTDPPVPKRHGIRQFLLVGRQHSHRKPDRRRSPSPLTITTHAAAQGVRPLIRCGSRRYVPAVHEGAANSGTLAAGVPDSRGPPATYL